MVNVNLVWGKQYVNLGGGKHPSFECEWSTNIRSNHKQDFLSEVMPIDEYLNKYFDTSKGPSLNIKTVFPRYGDSHVKDKTVGETVLSLTWESLYW